jgi:hypothetical protein
MQKFGWQDKEPNPKYNSNTSLVFKVYMIKSTNLLEVNSPNSMYMEQLT